MGPREWSPRFKAKNIAFEFPRITALMDNMKALAFVIGFVKEVNLSQFTEVKSGDRNEISVLDHVYRCKNSDALMVVRPWIRVDKNASKYAFDILRTSQYTLSYDGLQFIKESVEKVLIGEDGWVWKHPYRVPTRDRSVYDAAPLDEGNQAWGEKSFASFIANETKIDMAVSINGRLESPLFLYAGLVAALYSTAIPNLEKE